MKTLYEDLVERGLIEPVPASLGVQVSTQVSLENCAALTGKAFSDAVVQSEEFRLYVIEGLTERDLPPAVLCRILDHAWGKPPERVEHTGKDGQPIESVTEVRRVVVHVQGESERVERAPRQVH